MASTRLRLASLFAVAAIAAGACNATASPGASGAAGGDCTAGSAKAGANLQVPDVVAGQFNVAMVLIGPHDDGGWSQAHYEGLQYLCKNLAGSHVAYVELVPEGADSEQVFRSLARKGFNFIIGTSFGYMDPMDKVAKDFPDITFLHLTGFKSNGKNFGNFFGAVEDFKYLAGMLAGSRAKKDANPKIGYMATFPIPEEIRLGNAIARGVAVTCPECKIDVRFINTWHDPQKERDGAASLFDAGAQVVFTGADTPAVADVAKEKNKWAVTYDHPSSCAGKEACLTAPYWIWGPEYTRIGQQVKDKKYTAGYEYFDANSKAMGLLRLHGRRDAPEGRGRPAGGRRSEGQGHPGQDARRVVRPLRCLRRPDQGQHRQGAAAGRAEAQAAGSRPVPTRRARVGVLGLHVLVEREHHRSTPEAELGIGSEARGRSPAGLAVSGPDR